jgi:plasmid maintenance system killer protein
MKGRLTQQWKLIYQQDRLRPRPHNIRLPDPNIWVKNIVILIWDFVLDIWYDRNAYEHHQDEANISAVKDKLIQKIEWIQDSIPIQDLYIYKKLHIEQLKRSNLTNLYMLEQQLMILKKSSVHRIHNARDHEPPMPRPIDNG